MRADFDISENSWENLEQLIIDNFVGKEGDAINVAEKVIINCTGMIPQKYCQNNQYIKSYIRVNSLFPHKLEELAIIYKYNLIHITTDCVYSGKDGNYDEKSISDTTTIYGITKSLRRTIFFNNNTDVHYWGRKILKKIFS